MGGNHNTNSCSLSHLALQVEAKKQRDYEAIKNCLFNNPCISDEEISNITGILKSTVNGRRCELCYQGEVILDHKGMTNYSLRKVSLWRLATAEEKTLYFKQKKLDHEKLINDFKKQGRELAYSYYWGKGEVLPSQLMINAFIGAYLIGKGV